jgi:hypothetical protein
LRSSLRSQRGPKGEEFYRVDFVISVMLGGTSLKARLIWTEGVSQHIYPCAHKTNDYSIGSKA